MNAAERQSLVREVQLAGNCSHPIRLSGEMVNLATGEVGVNSLRVACKDRRRVVCPACSYTYKADAWILVSSGLIGGKGTPEEVGTHPRLFVTLTAPSFGVVHTIKSHGGCIVRPRTSGTSTRRAQSSAHSGAQRDVQQHAHGAAPNDAQPGPPICTHGCARFCSRRHEPGDPQLGRPLCERCFDYDGAVLWNAHVARLWNNTIQTLRRLLAEAGGVAQSNLKAIAQVHYLKVAEIQRRGLVHLHVIVRVDGPDGVDAMPPAWLSAAVFARVVGEAVRRATVVGPRGLSLRWGKVLDVRDLGLASDDATRVASYVAKYSTKTTDGSSELAHRFHSRRQIESLVDDPHARRLALAAWDLGRRTDLESLHLGEHAHAFGFTGQLITKSRGYSTTFASLRAARVAHMASRRVADPLEGTFHYDGRGYDDPRASELAEVFFVMQRELREEAAAARRTRSVSSAELS